MITRISTKDIPLAQDLTFYAMERKRTIEEIRDLLTCNLEHWKSYLDPVSHDIDDYQDDDFYSDGQWNDLTVSVNSDWCGFGWQTGDNSFTGGAYGYQHWAVVSFSHDTTVDELMQEIVSQLDELIA